MSLSFNTRQEALAYINANQLNAMPYGLRAHGKDRYEIRTITARETVNPFPRNTAPRTAKEGAAPTAKSICMGLYHPDQTRDTFVSAAIALGVKEVTARTMFSDIKAGRVK